MAIFINTDNSDKKNKIYNANLTGPAVDDAETKIKEMVIKAFKNKADFTTDPVENPKGYTIMLKVTTFKVSGGDTNCIITGEILRYPHTMSKKKGAGYEKVFMNQEWTGKAAASGKGTKPVVQCVEIITETMVPKSFEVMKSDMTRR